jgi:hypothetical protein
MDIEHRFLKPSVPLSTETMLKVWSAVAAVACLAVAGSIIWIDRQVAHYFLDGTKRFDSARNSFASPVIVGMELALLIILSLGRLVRGAIALMGKVLILAICASLTAFAANDSVLKTIIGRACPIDQLVHHQMEFHFAAGTEHSCFPSGHMVLASAFAFTIMRVYPRTWPLFAALLMLGTILLVTADAHFVADIIAGLFVGATAGFMAGELWLRHITVGDSRHGTD